MPMLSNLWLLTPSMPGTGTFVVPDPLDFGGFPRKSTFFLQVFTCTTMFIDQCIIIIIYEN